MTYGLSTRAFIEDGPAEQVAEARRTPLDGPLVARPGRSPPARARSSGRSTPANDRIDAFPLAL